MSDGSDSAPARVRVFAADCTVRFGDDDDGDGDDLDPDRVQRGRVVALVKPDRTVLVHDADGYQPAAWLTRADSVTVEADADGFAITARADERVLRVVSHGPGERWTARVGPAGVPVGRCPRCAGSGSDSDPDADSDSRSGSAPDADAGESRDDGSAGGALVRSRGDVLCLDCGARYGLPTGATVLDATCGACGLPTIRVERGDAFEVCLDPACESLAVAVREALDRRWACPDCGHDLRVRGRGDRLFMGCDGYPDCETAFSIPAGTVTGRCECGLPLFETATGPRCLDGTCEAFRADGLDSA